MCDSPTSLFMTSVVLRHQVRELLLPVLRTTNEPTARMGVLRGNGEEVYDPLVPAIGSQRPTYRRYRTRGCNTAFAVTDSRPIVLAK
jgi:hypothetical protein